MKVEKSGNRLLVTREPGDPKFRDGEWGSGESRLLYHVKQKIAAGEVKDWGDCTTDFVKKRMWKDGHLVSDGQLYLRSRKPIRTDSEGEKLYLAFHNNFYAINGLNDEFNQCGYCSIRMGECGITRPELGRRRR